MRYILNSEGYIEEVIFINNIECREQTCILYAGTTPSGYDSLEEWATSETAEGKLNAWKLQSGNLVYDANKYEELQALYEVQEEENAAATHEWVKGQLGKSSSVVVDELSNNTTGTSLVLLEDSGEYEIPKVVISSTTITGAVNVLASNKNLLGVDAVTSTISGVTITINADGTITLDGTATAAIELTLKGTSTNEDMLFLIKNDTDYTISGLTTGATINLYNYDGTDRTLIDNCTNETINQASSSIVTQTTLSIANGSTFDEVVISPQIEVGNNATTFVKHLENTASGTMSNNKATLETLNSYLYTTVLMADKEVSLNVDYFKYKSLEDKFASIQVSEENIQSQVNDTITSLTDLGETVSTIQSTILEQTNEAFTMWFEQTGIQGTLDAITTELSENTTDSNALKEYIHFEGAEITLGRSDSQTKLVIRNDRISFMTGETESAYISENTLYITDSTILNKMQIGRWETKEDDYGNLNTKWVGGE